MQPTHPQDALRHAMRSRYGFGSDAVRFVWAPYRICPLGAHIDHQLGTVTAMAIDLGTWLAYAPSPSAEVRLGSLSYPDEVRFPVTAVPGKRAGDWGNYARGAARALGQQWTLARGIVGVTHGDWPEAGLSSSAAVGLAYLIALEDANGLSLSAADNIRLDQSIENDYLGLHNGILDQSAILLSLAHRLTVVDCRAFAAAAPPPPGAPALPPGAPALPPGAPALPPGIRHVAPAAPLAPYAILLAHSGVTQAVTTTDYNTRVDECRHAARVLLNAAGRQHASPHLGNVSPGEYRAHQSKLSGPHARRARHFFGEMRRVAEGVAAWKRGDLPRFGRLMTESGESSIANYECGCTPMIHLFDILRQTPGVHGARFSGAGFRGCCVALIDREAARDALPAIRRAYARAQPECAVRSRLVLCQSGDGARRLPSVRTAP
ncbi:MAG: hypothetical protein JXQ71_01170 [Verrucomicrobia bacterium]|nr:hypothetical protein [Verrucomicrobiota bacterium]